MRRVLLLQVHCAECCSLSYFRTPWCTALMEYSVRALPKLPNRVPDPHPQVQPNLLCRWQPSLQLESPYLWPCALPSMCSSSESNTSARRSGTWSQFGAEPDMHPDRQSLARFVVHVPWCLHVGQTLPLVCMRATNALGTLRVLSRPGQFSPSPTWSPAVTSSWHSVRHVSPEHW